ncbi:MAG: TIGR01777 family oxidoreductase [Acidobacteriota bacterium]
MKILITGSSGMVGMALAPCLEAAGHTVVRLRRPPARSGAGNLLWDPRAGALPAAALEGCQAVIHLAGENLATGRWTSAKKKRIRESRVGATDLLCRTLASLSEPAQVLVSASAVGYYGDRGDERLTESSPAGDDFLARVCSDWETATRPASARGIRVVRLRFGAILSPAGGALRKMLLPFRLGLGGRLGDGCQYMSWIAMDDALRVIVRAVSDGGIEGPLNAVAPHPVTNRAFTRELARALSRPAVLPLPAPLARLAFGELADAVLLSSTRAVPERLQELNFSFRFPELPAALVHLLARGNRPVRRPPQGNGPAC